MVSLHRAVAIAMADGPLDGGPHPSAASASAWGQSPTCEGSTATPWIPNCTTPWLAFCTGLGYTLVALDGSGGWSSIRCTALSASRSTSRFISAQNQDKD